MYYQYNYNPCSQSYPPLQPPNQPSAYCSCIKYFHPGDQAPDFTLEGVDNLQPKSFRLRDYLDRWVLLFFYGSNFTFVWPLELTAVAAKMPRFNALNTKVLAISTDSIYSTKIMLQTSPSGRTVNFPILSDRALRVSRQYGILNQDQGFAYRASFIIDPEGRVQWSVVNPQPVGRSIEETLRIIEGLQYNRSTDQGLPPDWQPGDRGIPTGWDYVGKY